MLTCHVILLPVVHALVCAHVLLVRLRGIVPPIDAPGTRHPRIHRPRTGGERRPAHPHGPATPESSSVPDPALRPDQRGHIADGGPGRRADRRPRRACSPPPTSSRSPWARGPAPPRRTSRPPRSSARRHQHHRPATAPRTTTHREPDRRWTARACQQPRRGQRHPDRHRRGLRDPTSAPRGPRTHLAVTDALTAWSAASANPAAGMGLRLLRRARQSAEQRAPVSQLSPPANYGPRPGLLRTAPPAAAGAVWRPGRQNCSPQGGQFYQTDYTRPLLFLGDGTYSADLAQAQHLAGTQWGMMNEADNFPGQPWLWLYTFWYQIPPYKTSANGDALVWGLRWPCSARRWSCCRSFQGYGRYPA